MMQKDIVKQTKPRSVTNSNGTQDIAAPDRAASIRRTLYW